ncbi:amidohydrolase family protein [Caballeronia sp. DA-9]|uniref:amidohydrolase family protein n=1 Tax=Caballeronia sp. DA-9 TaxID=3436237 RepID=UPI003F666777
MNDALHDVAQRYPDRLHPMFHLPVQHPALAAETVQHWRECAAPLFAMPAGSAQHQLILSDDAYEPPWQALARHTGPVPAPVQRMRRPLRPLLSANLLGSPVETAPAAFYLALSGALDRHPDFTLCLAHGGGATAAVASRLERGQITGRPGADTGARRSRDVFRHVCVDCITHDPSALVLAATMHGDVHVFFGSD